MVEKKIPNKLYKYKTVDEYTANILTNNEAFLCSAEYLDDMFECSVSIPKKIYNNDVEGCLHDLLPSIVKRVSPVSSEEIKITDVEQLVSGAEPDIKKFKSLILEKNPDVSTKELRTIGSIIKAITDDCEKNKKLKEGIINLINIKKVSGLCSLTTRKKDQPMWTFYANDYKGYMIEYDIKSYIVENYKRKKNIRKVIYSNKRYNSPFEILLDVFYQKLYKDLKLFYEGRVSEEDVNRILLTKKTDWRFQREWRIIGPANTIEHIPIKAVYLGHKMSESHRNFILKIAEEKKFKVYQQEYDTENCVLTYKKIYTIKKSS